MKSSKFIQTTDYATLKNDDIGQVSLTIPTITLAPGAKYTKSEEIDLGTRGAPLFAIMNSSWYPSTWCVGNAIFLEVPTVATGGVPNTDPSLCTVVVDKVSPTRVRIYFYFNNITINTLSIQFANMVVTARILSFLSP